jgi:hypothetical protein
VLRDTAYSAVEGFFFAIRVRIEIAHRSRQVFDHQGTDRSARDALLRTGFDSWQRELSANA